MRLPLAVVLLILAMSSVCAQTRDTVEPTASPTPHPRDVKRTSVSGGNVKRSPQATVRWSEPPSKFEFPLKPPEDLTALQDFLSQMNLDYRELLLRVIPVTNTRSLFMFAEGGNGKDFPYWVKLVDEEPNEYNLRTHIKEELELRPSLGPFLGIHRLAGKHYLMVFYDANR
jgi:hypothetical protein